MSPLLTRGRSARELNSTAFRDDVDVLAGPIQEQIPHEATNHKCPLTPRIRNVPDLAEDGVFEVRGEVHSRGIACKGKSADETSGFSFE